MALRAGPLSRHCHRRHCHCTVTVARPGPPVPGRAGLGPTRESSAGPARPPSRIPCNTPKLAAQPPWAQAVGPTEPGRAGFDRERLSGPAGRVIRAETGATERRARRPEPGSPGPSGQACVIFASCSRRARTAAPAPAGARRKARQAVFGVKHRRDTRRRRLRPSHWHQVMDSDKLRTRRRFCRGACCTGAVAKPPTQIESTKCRERPGNDDPGRCTRRRQGGCRCRAPGRRAAGPAWPERIQPGGVAPGPSHEADSDFTDPD